MGRLCARQSNIPKPPFPSRNRLDEVHAARSAQTICAFRRGGRQPPAGRTLCAPTLWVLFLGRVELQGEVRDMGPGRRCHAAARARPGRFRCDSGWSPGRLAALCSPSLRSKLPCSRPARFSITLRHARGPGRFRCGSGWSPGRLAALRSPSLRSKLPCSRPARFSLSRCGLGAWPGR